MIDWLPLQLTAICIADLVVLLTAPYVQVCDPDLWRSGRADEPQLDQFAVQCAFSHLLLLLQHCTGLKADMAACRGAVVPPSAYLVGLRSRLWQQLTSSTEPCCMQALTSTVLSYTRRGRMRLTILWYHIPSTLWVRILSSEDRSQTKMRCQALALKPQCWSSYRSVFAEPAPCVDASGTGYVLTAPFLYFLPSFLADFRGVGC